MSIDPALLAGNRRPLANYQAQHFLFACDAAGVARITLSRPERKNPLSFESYAELRELFRALKYADDVKAIVLVGAGDNFCSGGDVHEIIGPLLQLAAPELLMFTRMTGDLVLAMRACPQPIVAAIDGVCAGAGAILAMASDLRLGTARSKTAFLFNRVGLAGCDMGACAMLPRLIGQGRASELLYTGRSLGGEEAERWGFFNRLCVPEELMQQASELAAQLAAGPNFANGLTKTMLGQEWSMGIEQAIEAEAQAQALCMLTQDFRRAYEAFVAKQRPVFEGIEMNSFLDWPFFEPRHRELATQLEAWAQRELADAHGPDVDAICVDLVRRLGRDGWLRHAIAQPGRGIDTRAICLIRETLARHSGLADFAFAMQGLGSGAISLDGTAEQQARYLPRVERGDAIAAFALSEPEAGSDVAALQCSARLDGEHYVLDGEKTWISNGGIADFYVVFARTGEAAGSRGISAFIVDAGTPGFEIAERIHVIAPHPLARLRFTNCRIPVSQRLGEPGQGFKLAMRTLDVFRTSVAAAALGFARRALQEGLLRARRRPMFGGRLADLQLTQAKLAQMATTIDSAALLTYRAAWQRDQGRNVTREAAMAKMVATEGAQEVIDAALQLHGGLGVVSEQPVERLYREIRALRIYEGATEVQQLIIARELLKEADEP